MKFAYDEVESGKFSISVHSAPQSDLSTQGPQDVLPGAIIRGFDDSALTPGATANKTRSAQLGIAQTGQGWGPRKNCCHLATEREGRSTSEVGETGRERELEQRKLLHLRPAGFFLRVTPA